MIALKAGFIITMSFLSPTALAEKYPLLITAEKKGEVAEIRISGGLYEWNNSTDILTSKIDKFIADGVQDVDVYINSPGGDVFCGAEIANQIKRFKGNKRGFGGAVVASAATIIAIEMDSFEMAENGQFMYHKPSASFFGNEDKVESSLKLLKNLSAQYKKSYADKTGMSEEEIEANWAKGDVWLSATEALEQKFITGVIKKTTITPDTKAMFEAFGVPNNPQLQIETKTDTQMKNRNQILALLKLPADASDEQIEAAVKLSTEASTKVESMTKDANEKAKKEGETFIDSAIEQKKFTADLKEKYVALWEKDPEGTKAIIEAMQVVPKASNHLDTSGEHNAAGREKWTMEDWQEKDANGLAKMMVENPTAFAKLEAEYFGTN